MNALPGLGHFPASQLANRRFREAGDLTLDLIHQDGRVEDRWLHLEPREFAIMWRLAERPGEPVPETALMTDLWRLRSDGEVGDIAGHIAGLAAKLAATGLADLVVPLADGCYGLAAAAVQGLLGGSDPGPDKRAT